MSTILLVTGATGTVGRFVVRALIEAGFAVRGQYRRCPGEHRQVDWRQCDFSGELALSQLVEGCEGVIHLAAEQRNFETMYHINVETTRSLAKAAEAQGARYFAHASSIVVYGSPLKREVDEQLELIDPSKPLTGQYRAEPFMREYARTKTLSEIALRELDPAMRVDLLRLTVVSDLDQLVAPIGWKLTQKLISLHRCPQAIYAADVAAAVTHLAARGLRDNTASVEAYNICDDRCGTCRDLYRRAQQVSVPTGFVPPFDLPIAVDLAKDIVKYRSSEIRYPLGLLKFSNRKLRETEFRFPVGYSLAVDRALERRAAVLR